jgi:hypothetical protein
MKLTIIKDDGAVYKDGITYTGLTLDTIPSEVHALQWNTNAGHIEYVNNSKLLETILDIPEWGLNCIAAWDDAAEKERLALEAAAEKERIALAAAQLK